MITEVDVNPTTLVAKVLQPPWRHALYQALDSPDNTAALWNAVNRAAAVAEVSAEQLRQIVEAVVAEGYEGLAGGFVHNPNITEAYLLELCDRGVLTDELGHRTGPRSLLKRLCEVHQYPEAVLTLGRELYRDPAVPPGEFTVFAHRYRDVSEGWLLRTLAEVTPDSRLKQTAYEDTLRSTTRAWGGEAAAVHARYLANEASGDADRLARFLDQHADAQVLALPLDSPVPDPARSELLESRARESTDPRVSDALQRRQHRRDAASPSLDPEAAAVLAATDDPDVLLMLAANPRTPPPVLRELTLRRASHGARAIRTAATHTLNLLRRAEHHPKL